MVIYFSRYLAVQPHPLHFLSFLTNVCARIPDHFHNPIFQNPFHFQNLNAHSISSISSALCTNYSSKVRGIHYPLTRSNTFPRATIN